MSQQTIFHHATLEGGITVLGEEMPHLASAAFSLLLGAGAATDPLGQFGAASVVSEMLQKGAGEFDSRQLSEQFESLGAHRGHSSGIEVFSISSAQLSDFLLPCLALYGKVLTQPRFPVEELESVRALALQDLEALEDEPASKVMNELAGKFYPAPFNRSQLGTAEGIKALSIDSLRTYYDEAFRTSELVIGVAGAFEWEQVVSTIREAFSGWRADRERLPVGPLPATSQSFHEQKDTKQVQIALAYPSVSFEHPLYYASKLAVSVLSGGMSGRLFVEVREKRGLVYRVSASQSAARGRSAIFASAGTTPENSEETLSVMMAELRGVANNLTEDELQRAKADLKSKVIMRSESSSVRSASLVNDWWNLQRVRTLEEVKSGIDTVTIADIEQYARAFPVEPVTLMTLGPKPLEIPS